MPAYRSEAEAEVRQAVVARLRQHRPNARIMHEVNVTAFGNRVDVLAVDRAEIIAVEVKSAKDKLDRLSDQLKAMRGCAHHSIAALHEKFLVEQKTHAAASQFERDGDHYMMVVPEIAHWAKAWVYPERRRAPHGWHDHIAVWRFPDPAIQQPLPAKALDMLWRAELLEMCGAYSVSVPKRPVMEVMTNALRWQLSGRDLTLGICAALRARICIEADPAIQWSQPHDP